MIKAAGHKPALAAYQLCGGLYKNIPDSSKRKRGNLVFASHKNNGITFNPDFAVEILLRLSTASQ